MSEQKSCEKKTVLSLDRDETHTIVERVLVSIKNVHAFRIPPLSTRDWECSEWKDEVWQGSLKIIERENMYFTVLFCPENQKVFAVCRVQKGNINRCIDSSRYFVFKIEDTSKKKHIFIGVAFEDRNEAFDFNVALQDTKREQENERFAVDLISTKNRDYGLKEGEKMLITIPTHLHKIGNNTSIVKGKKKKGDEASKQLFKLAPSKRDVLPIKRNNVSVKISNHIKPATESGSNISNRFVLRDMSKNTKCVEDRSNEIGKIPHRIIPKYLKNAGMGSENLDSLRINNA